MPQSTGSAVSSAHGSGSGSESSAEPVAVPGESVTEFKERIQTALDEFLNEQRTRLGRIGPESTEIVDGVEELLRGGKRLRALFCYWGWRSGGGADNDAIVRTSAALELFQAAALIHDDLMDNSETRRGMPAVHRRFAHLHRTARWQGDSDDYGAAGAILAGDLSLVWSDELFTGAGMSPEESARGRVPFDRMRSDLMLGQYLDLYEQARADSRPEAMSGAVRVLQFKSAKYTIEEPLQIGAAMAGASEELLGHLSTYGLALGQAFQLRDDVLGILGNPEVTGKPSGDDLMEGKRTVLIIEALTRLNAADGALLESWLGRRDLSADDVKRAQQMLVDCGAIAAVEERIDELVRESHEALTRAQIPSAAHATLLWLIEAATARKY